VGDGRPGPSVRVAVTVMVVGVVLGIPCALKAIPPFLEGLTGPVRATPLDARFQLGSGTYGVYERTGTQRGGGGFTFTENDVPRIAAGGVTVLSPAGQQLPTRDFGSGSETITRNEAIFTGTVRFDVETPGVHRIRIAGERSGQVIIARSLGGTFTRVAPWLALGAGAGLIVATGAVLLAIGVIRRDRAEAAAWTG
jgi:hypothetical protein